MPIVRELLMGNGRWWSWECPGCERYLAVEHRDDDPPETARCPSCNDHHFLDEKP